MRDLLVTSLALFLIVSVSGGCATQQKKELTELKHPGPVDCSTAQGDLRLLHHEKANVAERALEGSTAI